jgi:hypothetical protein
MGLLVRRLAALTDLCSREDGALILSGASFIDRLALLAFRPLPESAHLAVYRNAHDRVPPAKLIEYGNNFNIFQA